MRRDDHERRQVVPAGRQHSLLILLICAAVPANRRD
jgi:hypothetical protein